LGYEASDRTPSFGSIVVVPFGGAVAVERTSSSTPLHGHDSVLGRFRRAIPPAPRSLWQPATNAFFIFPSHGSPGLRPLYRRPRSRKAKIHHRNESAAGFISNHNIADEAATDHTRGHPSMLLHGEKVTSRNV